MLMPDAEPSDANAAVLLRRGRLVQEAAVPCMALSPPGTGDGSLLIGRKLGAA